MLLTYIINGLMSAASLLLLSLGMSIIFGIMGVVNLAHGEIIIVGAYVTYTIMGTMNLPFWLGMPTSFVVTAILGAFIEKLFIKRLYGRIAETLLVTYAFSSILQQVLKFIYGANSIHVSQPVSGVLTIGESMIPIYYVVLIVVAVIVFAGTQMLFNKTRIGMQIRAVSQNRTMSECLGVNVKLIDTLTFAFGAGLTGLAGCLIAPINSMSPFVGANYMVDNFMAVVLGGVDTLFGTVLGSFLMGEGNSVLGGLTDAVFAEMIVVLAVVITIRFRPKGLIVKERR